VPVRTTGRILTGRHHHPRRASGRRHLPVVRIEDVDLRRRPRAVREHRASGAGQDLRSTGRYAGHLIVHRPEVPGDRWATAERSTPR
jgi:hypothetical protein